jgi:hypothetical protein
MLKNPPTSTPRRRAERGTGGVWVGVIGLVTMWGAIAYFACCRETKKAVKINREEMVPFKATRQDDLARLGFSKL